ncbi:MAG: TonB-dependent receptor, partial [Candidatus Symbiothrix sp.]|nr:TonB-dependent receptor [Candidatus Symbiothrix sp.]
NGPDDRWIYPADASYRNETKGAYVLTNTHQGWGYTGNITIRSTPAKDLNLMLAYTHTESREISGMPSSTASSAWSKVPSVNGPNFSRLERSQYVTPDKLTGSLMVRIPYLKNRLSTDIGLFYAGYSPYSYSYIYSNDINNDGITNDLIYIPKNKNEIAFKTAQDANLFWHFLENDRYLSRHKGQYAEAFAVNAPWMHRFDLKIVQNFSIKSGNNTNTLQVSVNILNVGNLLNSTWGLSQQMLMPANGKILTYNKDDKTYSFFSQNKIDRAFANDRDVSQTWKLQVGVRYIFH